MYISPAANAKEKAPADKSGSNGPSVTEPNDPSLRQWPHPLIQRACSIINTCLCLGENETLLVVTDDTCFSVGALFYDAAASLKRRALLMVMPELEQNGQEPPVAVAAAMREASVALCPTAKSITHTNARIAAAQAGTRVVTMPGITMEMLQEGAATANYAEVERLSYTVADLLTKAQSARLEKDDHVLEFDLRGRSGIASPGIYRNPGESGNFPSGEAYIAPLESGVCGSMVIDGSMVGIGMLGSPLIAHLEAGRLVSLEGDEAHRLDALFTRPENGTIAELGIGTNTAAKLSGIILEDEKLYGTVHIAFGTNTSFGGTTKADLHYDGVILKPTLWLDNTCIMKDGELLV